MLNYVNDSSNPYISATPHDSINVRPKLENGRIPRIFPATDAAAAAGVAARDDQDDG